VIFSWTKWEEEDDDDEEEEDSPILYGNPAIRRE
jgi:hypothetical protein